MTGPISNSNGNAGDWEVSWLGGWNKHRHFYLVMLLKVAFEGRQKQETPPGKYRGR